VGFRAGDDGGPNSGERGTIKITEVLWSGSVANDGTWDPTDVFVELRNESNFPTNITGWQLVFTGSVEQTLRIPDIGHDLGVDDHAFFAAKNTGCFPDPDGVIPGLRFSQSDPFEITLLDFDDRLIEPVGSTDEPAFAGGYDLVESRSMERVELLFGADGTSSTIWHYYTDAAVDVPNNDRISPDCSEKTLASPGRPSSPDYSGATSSGSLE
jgi:hypothetical protein